MVLFKIKIPPYSPDINVIELVWAKLKKYTRKKVCRSKQALVYRIQKFFQYKMTPAKCQKYLNHMNHVNYILLKINFVMDY